MTLKENNGVCKKNYIIIMALLLFLYVYFLRHLMEEGKQMKELKKTV